MDEWVTAIGLRREDYGTHSLRRTKAAMIYKATGNLRAIQILLGHTKIENTVRYLGVDIEDALELAEQLTAADCSDIKIAISTYETKMRQRAAQITEVTLQSMENMHAKEALKFLVDTFQRIH